jgi:tetratricopeptide (TPR) repeat protein
MVSMDRIPDARTSFQEAINLYEKLAVAHPKKPGYRSSLAQTRSNLARVIQQSKDLPGAIDVSQTALDAFAALFKEVGNPTYRFYQVKELTQLASFQAQSRHTRQAIELLQQALEFQQMLRSNYPENDEFREYLAVVDNAFASLLATCDEPECRDSQQAILLATRACELTEWRNSYHLDTLAEVYHATGDIEKAIEWQAAAVRHASEKDKDLFTGRLKKYESDRDKPPAN